MPRRGIVTLSLAGVLAVALSAGAVAQDASAPPPTLADDAAVTALGVPVTIDVLANDDAGSAVLAGTSEPAHGTVALRDGRVVYTPLADHPGEDRLEYRVAEYGSGVEATAVVTITVLPQPGTVALGRLYTAEVNEDLGWDGINAAGDRVSVDREGSIVLVRGTGERLSIDAPAPAEYVLARGIADDGTVIAQYLDGTRFQWIGFTWKDGAHGRICDLGEGLGDCTPESMDAQGTIVGTTYDYAVYTGFVWPEGGDRAPLSLDGYASTYAYDIAPDGTVVGTADDSSDGYSGPSRCFAGQPGSLAVLPFTDGDPHFVSCRATNTDGAIVGYVKPRADQTGVPRSITDRARATVWHPEDGFAYVRFPFPRPSAESWRAEFLTGLNDEGVMVGYFQDISLTPTDDDPEQTEYLTRGITLTPVEALPGTSFEDSSFDHVDGPG